VASVIPSLSVGGTGYPNCSGQQESPVAPFSSRQFDHQNVLTDSLFHDIRALCSRLPSGMCRTLSQPRRTVLESHHHKIDEGGPLLSLRRRIGARALLSSQSPRLPVLPSPPACLLLAPCLASCCVQHRVYMKTRVDDFDLFIQVRMAGVSN